MQTNLIDRYVGLWNEADAETRRRTIAALWAPDGATCYRELDSRGHPAIEERVRGAYEKWVRDQGFVFRARNHGVAHHDVVRFQWEMAPAAGGAVAAVGTNLLVLDPDGRIRFDYQFAEPPTPVGDLNELVERYVAFWNESDAERRRRLLGEVWAADGAYVSPNAERRGREAVEAEAIRAYQEFVARGFVFRSAGNADGHHDVVRFNWEMRRRDGGALAALGLDVLVLDDVKRIRFDYQFDEPLPA